MQHAVNVALTFEQLAPGASFEKLLEHLMTQLLDAERTHDDLTDPGIGADLPALTCEIDLIIDLQHDDAGLRAFEYVFAALATADPDKRWRIRTTTVTPRPIKAAV